MSRTKTEKKIEVITAGEIKKRSGAKFKKIEETFFDQRMKFQEMFFGQLKWEHKIHHDNKLPKVKKEEKKELTDKDKNDFNEI